MGKEDYLLDMLIASKAEVESWPTWMQHAMGCSLSPPGPSCKKCHGTGNAYDFDVHGRYTVACSPCKGRGYILKE